MDEDDFLKLSTILFQGRSNHYVFSKAVGEHVAAKLSQKNIYVAIVRPSIVISAIHEPAPGWSDSVNGPMGIFALFGAGICVTSNYNYSIMHDYVCVDHLANFLLTTPWYITSKVGHSSASELEVYNLASSRFISKRVEFYDLLKIGHCIYLQAPSQSAIRPSYLPSKDNSKSRLLVTVEKFIFHTFYAYFLDLILSLLGYKPILVKYVQKMHKAFDLLHYFANNEWTFSADNTKEVIKAMNITDSSLFNCNLHEYDKAEAVVRSIWMGTRRYILKEPDSTINKAKLMYIPKAIFYRLFWTLISISLGLLVTNITMLNFWLSNWTLVKVIFTIALGFFVCDIVSFVPELKSTSPLLPEAGANCDYS
jgi:PREDICTED: similar to ENSANGP00000021191